MAQELRQQCHTFIAGNREPSPAELFANMSTWCLENDIEHDVYGEGLLIQQFEQQLAQLLGFEAGLFVISGTMTQPTVLQLVCDQKNNSLVAMHESSHIFRHERQGYQLQNRFNILTIGDMFRPWTLKDLKQWPDDIAAVLYELPMREIGGQLPTWQQLQEIKEYCHEQKIHLHMDGARLWEAAAYYQKSYQEIAQGFDSVYVSLYKGINGLGGSMLLGNKPLLDCASMWMKRQGGNVYHRTPYIVSAAMQFERRIAAMPQLFERTQQVYQILSRYPQFVLNPTQPQANMFHIYLPVSYENAVAMRDKLASEQGVWIGNPQITALPQQSMIEWYVGDHLLNMPDEKLTEILGWLSNHMR
ncbi:beta-eliminating lyase-related protein [Vibrio aestuarianus]|uniref:Low-specificity L-threonine aldolase n=1 Tax=Vibrio aestuarianus TaxID=28171 RepID=A0ABN8TLX4_9VIBR|nr:beta-eliminating lyase-related protein [Vibrio aestuarianus]MDE1255166.1 beta-eliminating lyase-related protein [Vibrio aestuarianus]MDH5900895.1 beta-eliminating lyase-related protein [Vibrio aestuarianus]CAH8205353.1 Low-specificity L-threonine aldolase [Vibrio aestuarianus]